MDKTVLKKIGIYAGIVILFLVLAYAFVPQVLSGQIVNQSDIKGYSAMAHESSAWNSAHPDDVTYWTDSMFGGMPTTSFSQSHEGDWTQSLYDLLLKGKRPATYLFISLLGAFLLMLSLGIDKLLAIGGAIAVTFCSYNIQIIQVGHNTKMQALAFLPWALAAVIFTYKSALKDVKGWKKWLPATVLGAVLFGFAISLQIKANHQQITYYLAIMIAVYVLAVFIALLCSEKGRAKIGKFFAASALLLVIGLVGIGTNTIKLAPLYQYTKYTMRGGSELSHPKGGQVNNDGLQLDYATAWSYGWQELPNMLIPDFNGGASAGAVNPDKSAVVKLLKDYGQPNADQAAKALPLYWGPQPFTAGPMYMGAITIFLFLLGLFLYKGKEKWWMLAATILAIFLAVGSHMMWFTKLFFDYVPMYSKFRTVSMALVILQFTLPMLGFLTLDRIMKQEYSRKEFMKGGLWALGISAGFCLLCMVIPGIAGSFSGASDSQMQDVIVDALKQDRRYLLTNDALWSMLYIVATFGLIWWAYSVPKEAKKTYESDPHIGNARRTEAAVAICVLVLVNMFTVGHRYLGAGDFTTPREFKSQFNERTVDKMILEDPAPSYRVVDLTADIFNDNFTPYLHKCIGGYSPAKLQRYQDLIDRYITDELNGVIKSMQGASTIEEAEESLDSIPVLNALNLKYVIINAEASPLVNSNAFGTAWFVDSVKVASTPDEEIASLGEIDLHKAAVIADDFKEGQAAAQSALAAGAAAPSDSICMTSYAPNEVRYHYSAAAARPAVFSEVYYPEGWSATVDGQPLELYRTDWILRGAVLPDGEHEVVMRFAPAVYSTSANVSRASSAALVVLLLAAAGGMFAAGRRKEDENTEETK